MAQQREKFEDTAHHFEERAEELHTEGVAKNENKVKAKMGKVLQQVQQQHQGDIAQRDRVIVQAKSELRKKSYEVQQQHQELHLYQGTLSKTGGDSNRRHAELQQVINVKNHFENEAKNMSDKQQQYVDFAHTEQQAAAQANATAAQANADIAQMQATVGEAF